MSTLVVRGHRNSHDIVPLGWHHLPIHQERGLVLVFLMEVIKETPQAQPGISQVPSQPETRKVVKKIFE